MNPKYKDITGMVFGRLTAISFLEKRNGSPYWTCKCTCGNESIVRKGGLVNKRSQSCGCLSREWAKSGLHSLKHGLTRKGKGHKLHWVWSAMKERCDNPNVGQYNNYGGRGIKVCEEWYDLSKFHKWAIASGYEEGRKLSIDRIDNNKNYCPENCRWVDQKTQSRNKRNNVILTYNSESRTLVEWAEIIGIHHDTLRGRLRRGWNAEKTLTSAVKKHPNNRKEVLTCMDGRTHQKGLA